jgi:hypothetical protein
VSLELATAGRVEAPFPLLAARSLLGLIFVIVPTY